MNKYAWIPVAALAFTFSTGARAQTAASASPQHAPANVEMSFDVRNILTDGVLLSGGTALQFDRPLEFQRRTPLANATVDFSVVAHNEGDGNVQIQLHWRSESIDGTRIQWTPAIVVALGHTGSVQINWPGNGLRAQVTLR